MSHEYGRPVPDADPPDIGFQAAFGFYLGLVAGGLVVLAGLVADATTATLLGTFPTVVTAVTLGGHVLAKRARGLPERIGRSRRSRLVCYLPAAGFAAAALAPSAGLLELTARYLVATVALGAVLAVTAVGLERLCRNRFVEAVTPDEPTATWSYRPAGALARNGVWIGSAALVAVGGLWTLGLGDPIGLLWVAYGAVMLASNWLEFDPDDGWIARTSPDPNRERGELRVHDRGVRYDRGRSRKLVPWERIAEIRLTEDELVLERRFRNLRCDRSAIDDPEAVYESLEETNSRVKTGTRTAKGR